MNKSVEEFLATYNPEVSDLALEVRDLILKLIPDATEQVDSAARIIAYGFGPKYADMICVIMPYQSALNLGFYKGKELPDPKGLLTGTGKLHRHVKITTAEDIESPALRQLIRTAHAAYKTRKDTSENVNARRKKQ